MLLSAKGPGWAPAVISSDEEMEFISANLRRRGYTGEMFIGSFFAGKTRMHSSRMHTVHCSGLGGCLPRGGVCLGVVSA